jgi:histidine triad (HIT) family protein
MSDCVFCNIISGKKAAEIVYEDDLVVAFKDAYPAAPVHILIVPRRHLPTFNDIPDGDMILEHMGRIARKIARDMGVAESGYRFFINVNRGGGQVVFHLHSHLVAGKDLGMLFIKLAVGLSILWRKLVGAVWRG